MFPVKEPESSTLDSFDSVSFQQGQRLIQDLDQNLTSIDAQAARFVFAHSQHLLVDVTNHSPGLGGSIRVLCGVVGGNVLPRRRLRGPRRPPLLSLLLKTNVLQKSKGDVT